MQQKSKWLQAACFSKIQHGVLHEPCSITSVLGTCGVARLTEISLYHSETVKFRFQNTVNLDCTIMYQTYAFQKCIHLLTQAHVCSTVQLEIGVSDIF